METTVAIGVFSEGGSAAAMGVTMVKFVSSCSVIQSNSLSYYSFSEIKCGRGRAVVNAKQNLPEPEPRRLASKSKTNFHGGPACWGWMAL